MAEHTVDNGQFQITDSEFRALRDFIHAHTGIALSDHKRALVCARLAKRLRQNQLTNFSDYYTLLNEHDSLGRERTEMINCITTNKTDFFREPHHFRFMSEKLLSSLHASGPGRARRLRIWSAGSSTGEEAYSIAMTVLQVVPAGERWDVKILASDIDTTVLARGEQGIYTREQARGIPEPLLHRYFKKGVGANAEKVQIKSEVADMVRFRHLNLLDETWPFQGAFDIVFCRNVIIYFDRDTQRALVERFARVLRPDGYLMLGHSESLPHAIGGLRHVGQSVYQRYEQPCASPTI